MAIGAPSLTGRATGVHCPLYSAYAVIANPGRCDQYYQCSNGVAYLTSCPSGLLFSAKHSQCVLPRDAECYVEQDVCDSSSLSFNIFKNNFFF